jgi:hypothetical protein
MSLRVLGQTSIEARTIRIVVTGDCRAGYFAEAIVLQLRDTCMATWYELYSNGSRDHEQRACYDLGRTAAMAQLSRRKGRRLHRHERRET